jgi:hypothetical protein
MAELTYDQVSQLLKYEPETGKLFWLPRPRELFKTNRSCSIWQARYAGKEAFTCDNGFGYRVGRIFDKGYLAHRICWLLAYKKWPDDFVDHVNGVRDDNRLCNFRDVSRTGNAMNTKLRVNNTSGVNGIGWYKAGNNWQVYIAIEGKQTYLGHFDDFDEAIAVRKAAEVKYGYHKNHGRSH